MGSEIEQRWLSLAITHKVNDQFIRCTFQRMQFDGFQAYRAPGPTVQVPTVRGPIWLEPFDSTRLFAVLRAA